MEKRNKFLSGMLAMALMFSLVLLGCSTDSDDGGGGGGNGGNGGGGNLLNGNSYTAMGNSDNEWTLTFTSATAWEHVHLTVAGEKDTGTYTCTDTTVTFSPAINGVTTGTLNKMGSPIVRTIKIADRTYYTD